MFIKGGIPWNKGKKGAFKHTPETIEKLRLISTGKKYSVESRMKMGKHRIGKKHTPETIEKMRSKLWGNKRGLGNKWTEERRLKMSLLMRGENAPGWKGGIHKKNLLERKRVEYKIWRDSVYKRDNYTCQNCGLRNGKGIGKTIKLQAHHVKSFADYPELRLEISNGITLCEPCHKKTDTYGGNYNKVSNQNYKKCLRCGVSYKTRSGKQKYCGSKEKKEGCSHLHELVRKRMTEKQFIETKGQNLASSSLGL